MRPTGRRPFDVQPTPPAGSRRRAKQAETHRREQDFAIGIEPTLQGFQEQNRGTASINDAYWFKIWPEIGMLNFENPWSFVSMSNKPLMEPTPTLSGFKEIVAWYRSPSGPRSHFKFRIGKSVVRAARKSEPSSW